MFNKNNMFNISGVEGEQPVLAQPSLLLRFVTLREIAPDIVFHELYPFQNLARSNCLLKHASVALLMTQRVTSYQSFITLVDKVNYFRCFLELGLKQLYADVTV